MTRLFSHGTFPPIYFSPDDPAGGAAPSTPTAAPSTPPTPTAAPEPVAQDNQANMWRRKAEDAQKKLDEIAAAEQKRKDEELSEVDRLKKEAAEAKSAADAAKLDALRLKAGKALPDDALEFLTGTDAETLAAQAEKLAALYGNAPQAAKPAVQAGTKTQPAAGAVPSVQEKITAAAKAGNSLEAIRLMRQEQFGDKA